MPLWRNYSLRWPLSPCPTFNETAMNFPVFRRLFTIFGLIHYVYDSNHHRYVPSCHLTIYGILVSLLIQSFTSFSFYVRRNYILQALLTIRPLSVMATVIVAFDCAMWIILGTGQILSVILRRNRIGRILNQFLRYEDKYLNEGQEIVDKVFHARLRKVSIVFGTLVTFGNCFVGFYNYGLKPISVFTVISHYCLTSQFILGHSYELMFFEKLQLNFLMLEQKLTNIVKDTSFCNVRICIRMHAKLLSLSKKTTNVFGPNKIVCLASLTILISVYWFYTYDHVKSVVPTLVWQMILSMVFVVCHSWDRMCDKVSSIYLKTLPSPYSGFSRVFKGNTRL